MNKDSLGIWTVYDHPVDMPDYYVARLFEVTAAGPVVTDQVLRAKDLAEIRVELMERGLTRLERFEQDEAHIIEVWL